MLYCYSTHICKKSKQEKSMYPERLLLLCTCTKGPGQVSTTLFCWSYSENISKISLYELQRTGCFHLCVDYLFIYNCHKETDTRNAPWYNYPGRVLSSFKSFASIILIVGKMQEYKERSTKVSLNSYVRSFRDLQSLFFCTLV